MSRKCDYLDWHNTIEVLSLDLTSLLIDELGVQRFYTDGLQEIARNYSGENSLYWSDADFKQNVESFLNDTDTELGVEVGRALRSWHRLVHPEHAATARYFLWSCLLWRLRHAWDEPFSSPSLPFSTPLDAEIRIWVRDFLDHVKNVRDEIHDLEDCLVSRWDKRLQGRNGFSASASISEMINNLRSREFWTNARDRLDPSELDALLQWARTMAKNENMPLRYVRIPR